VLDGAVARARSDEDVPEQWVLRVERLGTLGIKTYIAALGGALLAKATDAQVDSLAQDAKAGPRGYSLRTVTEFLAEHNYGRFHMGATGRWPLNNSPFLRGPARIDEVTKVSKRARPSYELFLDSLLDINRMDERSAREAFAAWLRVRMRAREVELADAQRSLALSTGLDPSDLFEITEIFVREDPEGGKRGQAFVAAVLDCAFDEVSLQSINHPRPGDVKVLRGGSVVWVLEVKQVAVEEQAALDLAREAREVSASLAMLAVIADHHQPLDRERIRRQALKDYRVMLEVTESARELISTVCVFSTTTIEQIVERFPGRYAERMREHEVSPRGRQRWADLVAARRDAVQ
jgi:hypothetical protein